MFTNFHVTNIGHALLAKAQSGTPIQFTRFAMGKGWLPSGQDIEEVTAMVDPIRSLPYAVEVSGTVAAISVQITNHGMTSRVEFRELGLYANDPDKGEILYAYANAGANADLIPSASESQVDYLLSFACKMRNASVIEILQQQSLLYASLQQFDGHAKDYNNPHGVTLGQVLGGGAADGEIDCGSWDAGSAVKAHNADKAAHGNLIVDGNAGGVYETGELEAHEVDPQVHPNIIIDGNI